MVQRYTERTRQDVPWLTPEALAVGVAVVLVVGLFIALMVGGRRSAAPATCSASTDRVAPCR